MRSEIIKERLHYLRYAMFHPFEASMRLSTGEKEVF